mmetsp:Transcript_100088/g.278865  ORF Transcript_100088/g.278865 Transcript_100088/m.278865 type:complete len:260 (-) Transcript_100088:235-1014(-)
MGWSSAMRGVSLSRLANCIGCSEQNLEAKARAAVTSPSSSAGSINVFFTTYPELPPVSCWLLVGTLVVPTPVVLSAGTGLPTRRTRGSCSAAEGLVSASAALAGPLLRGWRPACARRSASRLLGARAHMAAARAEAADAALAAAGACAGAAGAGDEASAPAARRGCSERNWLATRRTELPVAPSASSGSMNVFFTKYPAMVPLSAPSVRLRVVFCEVKGEAVRRRSPRDCSWLCRLCSDAKDEADARLCASRLRLLCSE